MDRRNNDTIIRDPQAAEGYDEQARATAWVAPDVVFRMSKGYVRSGETLLDLGIGSGLSSLPFHNVGLHIYGVDGSREILDVCQAKGFAMELVLHDLRDLPLPYESARFDHVIAVGVLNSFPDLQPFVAEAARLMRRNGIFAFTVEDQKPGQERSWAVNRAEVDDLPDPETAVRLYRHRCDDVARLLRQDGFTLLANEDFVGFRYPAEDRDVIFSAYVARMTGRPN